MNTINVAKAKDTKTSLLAFIILISLLLVFYSYTLAVAQDRQPRIAISAETFDFGKLPQGQKLTHRFKVKNIGKGELVIEKAVPS